LEKIHFVPVRVGDTTIRVEATALDLEQDVAFGDLNFKEITDAIESVATAVNGAITKLKPKKASVEFGFEIGVESGNLTALLVKGTGKSNLKITLHWENE
jgi:hypothetical protein